MGFKKAGATTVAEPPAEAVAPPVTEAPAAAEPSYPTIPPPEDDARTDPRSDLRALHSGSDKDLRMMFAGIYQALSQSQALYAARNIMDVSQWHAAIEEEVEYFVRRVLERSQKE